VPRGIEALDVSVETLLAAMARSNSPSDKLAWSLDVELLAHPERCATDADYPGWTPGGAA
jgi:hypothetical protein